MNRVKKIRLSFLACLLSISCQVFAQTTVTTPHVESVLYLGKGKNQPLLVGLGGSEGGNAWTSGYWEKTRNEFIAKGYAFLAIGYFGTKGTPDSLQKIAIEDIHNAIKEGAKNPHINKNKIAIVGGSRGADLALLTACYFKDIKCVVAIVPSNVTFPGNTTHFTTSSWTYQNNELPFVPVNEAAIPFLMKHDLRGAFEAMLRDSIAVSKSLIKVERINGPILFMSATKDEICPSTSMCEKMMARLESNHFKYYFQHIPIAGGHVEPLQHFDVIFTFLQRYFYIQ